MAELLQFGDEGFHHVAVDLTFTESFILSTVAGTLRGVSRIYAYLNGSHLLSWRGGSKYKRQVYYDTGACSFSFRDI